MSPYLTIADAADLLKVSPRTIMRKIDLGELTAYKLGMSKRAPVRVTEEDVRALLRRLA